MDYPLLRRTLTAWRAQSPQSSQNAGLIFDRFAPDCLNNQEAKKLGLLAVKQAAARADDALLKAWQTRWQQTAAAVQAEPFTLRTDWRLVTGLGRKGPLEVGFTFHRYGFPILPGSSLKGLARAGGLLRVAEALNVSDLRTLDAALSQDDNEKFEKEWPALAQAPKSAAVARRTADGWRELFGTTANAGQAIFLDAIPAVAELPTLDLDIMNPHYPRYYQGSEAPTDSQNPIPVYFLTVAAGEAFQFAVGWRGSLDEHAKSYRRTAQTWLTRGLLNLGAGAKTSAGYGYFVAAAATAPAGAPAQTAAVVSPPPTVVAPAAARSTRHGRVKYDQGRAMIHDLDDPQLRSRVDWKKLGMDNLPDRTTVEYVVEETADGRRTVVSVRKVK
ncbi:MAG: type III-B CRISPR module RAMP protein Cmr6 [Anaerolineae bacterium]